MIRSASRFGFKIYFGDGTRLDVLRASGALTASAVAICVNKKEAASKITEIVKAEMPHLKILARSYDRIHARELVGLGVDYQMRETFESALLFGEATLREIGVDESEIEVLSADIRRRDKERFQLEILKNETAAGRSLLHSNMVKPLTNPQRSSQALNDDAKDLVKEN